MIFIIFFITKMYYLFIRFSKLDAVAQNKQNGLCVRLLLLVVLYNFVIHMQLIQ